MVAWLEGRIEAGAVQLGEQRTGDSHCWGVAEYKGRRRGVVYGTVQYSTVHTVSNGINANQEANGFLRSDGPFKRPERAMSYRRGTVQHDYCMQDALRPGNDVT